jgi:hypothetical protein
VAEHQQLDRPGEAEDRSASFDAQPAEDSR